MRWSTVVIGILAASGVAAEASALSLGSLQQAPLAEPAPAPPVPPGAANLILPAPPGWTPDAQGLPTLQDLAGASPIYTAPPPRRPRARRP
jgi:hypothetical protein